MTNNVQMVRFARICITTGDYQHADDHILGYLDTCFYIIADESLEKRDNE